MNMNEVQSPSLLKRGHIETRPLPAWLIRKEGQEREVQPPKVEYPGAPFADEMFGDLHVGPELPGLMAIINDETNHPLAERTKAASEITKLKDKAAENHAWWYGPLNERLAAEPKPSIESRPLPKWLTERRPIPVPEPVPDRDEPPETNDLVVEQPEDDDTDLDSIPKVEDQDLREETGNWLQRKLKGVAKYVKGETNDFKEYLPGKRLEMLALAAVGGIAGSSSVLIGTEAARIAMANHPDALVGLTGLLTGTAVTGLVNYGFWTELVKKWAGNKAKIEGDIKNYNLETDGEFKDFDKKVERDRKGRIRVFADADVIAKIATSIGLSGVFAEHKNEAGVGSDNHTLAKEKVVPPAKPVEKPVVPPKLVPPEPPVKPEVPQPALGDYIVKASDSSWEEILRKNGLNPIGPDSIKALATNRDNLIGMWTKWAAENGHHAIPIETGADAHMEYMPVDQVTAMLDRVITNGYPTQDLANHNYVEYAKQLAEFQRVAKWALPGTHLQFPVK